MDKAYLAREEKMYRDKHSYLRSMSATEKAEQRGTLMWFLSPEGREQLGWRLNFLFNGDFGQYEKHLAEESREKAFEVLCAAEFSLDKNIAAEVFKTHKEYILRVMDEENPPQTKKTVLEECFLHEDGLITLPDVKIPRDLYLEVKNSFELIGGKWNTSRQGFIFDKSPAEFLEKLRNGETLNIKKEFQFFATPKRIARRLVELADIKDWHNVLEPSAGQGAIVNAINEIHPSLKVNCYEFMGINRDFLKKIPTANLIGEDFLKHQDNPEYDRIIANPPFSKNQDLAHFMKMWESLKMNGTLICMTSCHWKHSSNKKEKAFQKFLDEIGAEVHEVAAGEFLESGTSVATLIIVAHKIPKEKD